MPTIYTNASVTNLPAQKVFELIEDAAVQVKYTEKKIKDFSAPYFKKEIEILIPSHVSSTGDCLITVVVQQDAEIVSLTMTGKISQFAVSTLTKKMDTLLEHTQRKVEEMQGSMHYEKLTKFLPNYKLHLEKRDRNYLIMALVVAVAFVLPTFLLKSKYVNPFVAILLAVSLVLITRTISNRLQK